MKTAFNRIALSAVLLGGVAGALAESDFSTPAAAFRTYTQALFDCDEAALKSAAIVSEKHPKLLGGMVEYIKVERQFRAAAITAFPEAARELPDPAKESMKAIDNATVKIEGDTAVLVTSQSVEPVKLRKVNGEWKVDLASMYNDDSVNDLVVFRGALTGVLSDMAADIEAGKYTSFVDVKTQLEIKVKMRIAMAPDEWPATRPVKQ